MDDWVNINKWSNSLSFTLTLDLNMYPSASSDFFTQDNTLNRNKIKSLTRRSKSPLHSAIFIHDE